MDIQTTDEQGWKDEFTVIIGEDTHPTATGVNVRVVRRRNAVLASVSRVHYKWQKRLRVAGEYRSSYLEGTRNNKQRQLRQWLVTLPLGRFSCEVSPSLPRGLQSGAGLRFADLETVEARGGWVAHGIGEALD